MAGSASFSSRRSAFAASSTSRHRSFDVDHLAPATHAQEFVGAGVICAAVEERDGFTGFRAQKARLDAEPAGGARRNLERQQAPQRRRIAADRDHDRRTGARDTFEEALVQRTGHVVADESEERLAEGLGWEELWRVVRERKGRPSLVDRDDAKLIIHFVGAAARGVVAGHAPPPARGPRPFALVFRREKARSRLDP
jgi:hypothetical protein